MDRLDLKTAVVAGNWWTAWTRAQRLRLVVVLAGSNEEQMMGRSDSDATNSFSIYRSAVARCQ